MSRRIVVASSAAEKRINEWVLCPDCTQLVEVRGGLFDRHYGFDVVCRQSGKYPPTYK